MKPIELEPNGQQNLDGRPDMRGYADTLRTYITYRKTDCIIAYRKCFMGVTFLIEGKKEMFAFLILNKSIGKWGEIELQRKSLREFRKLIDLQGDDKLIILDDELFKLYERKVLFNSI